MTVPKSGGLHQWTSECIQKYIAESNDAISRKIFHKNLMHKASAFSIDIVPMSPVLWSVLVIGSESFRINFFSLSLSLSIFGVFSFSRNIIHTLCHSAVWVCVLHITIFSQEKNQQAATVCCCCCRCNITAPPPIPTILTTSPSSSSSHHSMHIAFFSVGYSFSGKVLVGI